MKKYSKGFEAINDIWRNALFVGEYGEKTIYSIETKKAIHDQCRDVETELKALEIIMKKQVDVFSLITCFNNNQSVERYNEDVFEEIQYPRKKLTKEEFDFLRSVYKGNYE